MILKKLPSLAQEIDNNVVDHVKEFLPRDIYKQFTILKLKFYYSYKSKLFSSHNQAKVRRLFLNGL